MNATVLLVMDVQRGIVGRFADEPALAGSPRTPPPLRYTLPSCPLPGRPW